MRGLIITACLFFSLIVQAQEDYLSLARVERELELAFDELYSEQIPGTSLALYHSIDSMFEAALELPGSANYRWEKLDQIGKLKSDDGSLRVYSWLYMADRNTYHYSCFFQVIDRKGNAEIFKLKQSRSPEAKGEEYPQTLEDWHGKIYYGLHQSKYRRKTLYTLMGMDFNNMNSSMKSVEVIAIQRGKPVFRDDQFLDGGTVKDRMIFEYSNEVAISVRYNQELDLIVFDHLVPFHPLYHGNYQFYGPDGSYDGLKFQEGIWVMVEDVDARNR